MPLKKAPESAEVYCGSNLVSHLRVLEKELAVLYRCHVAQLAEQSAVNRHVVGSSPTVAAIELIYLSQCKSKLMKYSREHYRGS